MNITIKEREEEHRYIITSIIRLLSYYAPSSCEAMYSVATHLHRLELNGVSRSDDEVFEMYTELYLGE